MGDTNEIVVPDEESALVKRYKSAIERETKRHEERFKKYERNRAAYRGIMDEKGKLARTNLIFSTIATLYPQIYAKNPDISLSPAESVDDSSYANVKQYGKTAEVILQRMLMREANMKERAKSLVRATMLCEVGWLKLTYQKDVREDPIIKDRMNDIQDNIERIKSMTAELDEEGAGMDNDADLGALQLELQGLASRTETVVSSGLVVDKLMTEDLICLDPTIRDFYDYRNASALAQRTWFDEEKFEATFGRCPTGKASKWVGKTLKQAASQEGTTGKSAAAGDQDAEFFAVWEIWDKNANSVLTWCEGEEGWCRPPFQPKTVGRRWYPFFGLCFNPVDGEFYGVSDVDLLIELQNEYNDTRDALREHRKYSIPIRVVRAGGSLTPADVQAIRDAKYGQTVVIGGDSAVPLKNDVDTLEGPRIDPALYDVQMIRADIEMVSGASDAARGMVMQAKTATEAEIMQSGMASRTAERQDAIEDFIEEMAKYAIEMLTGELSIPEVVRFAGQGAVWPEGGQMDQVFDILNLEIRAGSSGKPNQNKERDQWIQLMPIVQTAMEKVMMLRQQGMDDMADAVIELTRESLHRFDERIDVDAFLPRRQKGANDPQAQAQQAGMQLQQAQVQMQQMQQVIQELQQQLAQAQDANAARLQDNEFKSQQAIADRANELEKEKIRTDARAMQQGVAEAMSNQKQVLAKLQGLEQAVMALQQEDAKESGNEDILKGIEQMIAPLLQKEQAEPPEAPEQPLPPINITVPITVEGKSGGTKRGTMKKNADGSYAMEVTEGNES